jgi:hypothetical protein
MDTETTANPVAEAETEITAPAVEDNSAEAAEDGQADEQNADQEGDAPEDEYEELEFDGERLSVPKGSKFKEGLMRLQDYTRKTMEVAEQRKANEAEAAAISAQKAEIERVREANMADLKAHAELHAINSKLEEYAKLDWKALLQEDPVKAMELQREEKMLESSKAERQQQISQRQHQGALKRQQDIAKLVQEGNAMLQREIKDWSPEKARTLCEYGQTAAGFSAQEMANTIDPRAFKILNKAYLYDQLIAKQQAVKQPPKVAPKALPTVGKSNKADNGLSDSLSDAEWMKRRLAEKSRKRP